MERESRVTKLRTRELKEKTSSRRELFAELFELGYLRKWLLLGVPVGVVSGVSAIIFELLLGAAEHVFLERLAGFYQPSVGVSDPEGAYWQPPTEPLNLLLALSLGGLLAGVLIYALSPESKGHGTDVVIRSFHRAAGRIRARVPFVKMLASTLTIGSGGSAGKEGPMMLIAGGLASVISSILKMSPEDRRIAVVIGMGAGLGSIFRSPLGGAVFAAEVLYIADIEVRAIVPSLIASTTSYAVFGSYHGFKPLFTLPQTAFSIEEIPFFALLGLVCGAMSILYVRTFYGTTGLIEALYRKTGMPPYFKPMLGALATGLLAIAVSETIDQIAGYGALGGGYGFLQLAMLNMLTWKAMLALAFTKIVTTSLTLGSGGSGGVFVPAIVIGGMVGGAMGNILHHLFPALLPESSIPLFVVLGMTALLAGSSKTPLAGMLIVSEMTGDLALLFPAMVAVFVSYVVSGKTSIYREQVETRADSPAHAPLLTTRILSKIRVWEAATKNVVTLAPHNTVAEVLALIRKTGHMGYPVVGEDGRLIGIVTFEDVKRAILELEDRRAEHVRVEEIMTKNLVVAYPDETLYDALRKLTMHNIGRLPVVKREDRSKLVGIITRSDILKAVASLLADREE
uniref:CBS domain-containing protein n=1 Tax=Fervidicoccus fontis TaxID=683846 RepID=A0A7J3ZL46_9CREN